MTNPAVEAAKRALPDNTFDPGHDDYSDTALAAAREMAKPIRDLHNAFADFYRDRNDSFASGIKHVLRDLAPLIYPEDEL